MPGHVLSDHGIVTSEGGNYVLNIRDNLTQEQIGELVQLCNVKINEYEQNTASKASGTQGLQLPEISRARCNMSY